MKVLQHMMDKVFTAFPSSFLVDDVPQVHDEGQRQGWLTYRDGNRDGRMVAGGATAPPVTILPSR